MDLSVQTFCIQCLSVPFIKITTGKEIETGAGNKKPMTGRCSAVAWSMSHLLSSRVSKLTRRANSHGSQMVNDHKDVFDHIQVVKLGQLCETITLLAIVVIKGE